MDAPSNHIRKSQQATKGAVCRNESENQTAHGLACDEDMIHHYNEQGNARGPAQKTEPAEEPDYDVEGMAPHN